MYREHFSLRERPFTHAPGKRFFAANSAVSETISHLQHVLTARDGIGLLSGGPGVGKTTLAECAIASMPDRLTVARVDLRYGEPADLYAAILLAIGEDPAGPGPVHALQALRHAMARFVREEQRLVLCLDVGGISTEIARHLLRVANLAGEHDCQMNILLMGPHSLHQQLDVPALIQLRQRILFRHRVRPLTLSDTDRYIRHQIEAVGGDATALIPSNLSTAIYCYVAGVPRLVNTLLDAALTDACLQKLAQPDNGVVQRTADLLGWKPMTPKAQADEAAKPASARSAPPKVATVPTAVKPAAKVAAAGAGEADLLPPGDMTVTPPRTGSEEAGASGRFAALSLAVENRTTNSGVSGYAEAVVRPAAANAAVPLIPMDNADPGATGMLRLQDLDERFAESIFGKDAAEPQRKKQ